MIATLAALALALAPAPIQAQAETWETLSHEVEQALEDWHEASSTSTTGEVAAWDVAPYRPRFLALAEAGEGRAVLWLIANRDEDLAPIVLELVERADEAPWLGSAFHGLVTGPEGFDAARLAALLEKRIAGGKDPAVRAQAAFARARTLDASDAARAAELRVWGAMLACQGVELGKGESLAPEDLAELGPKVLDTVNEAQQAHFELAYYPGARGVYFPRAGAPPDPREVWRPVVDELAKRGVRTAQFWSLSNAPWQVDEAAKAGMLANLEAITSAPLDAKELQTFGYQIEALTYRLGPDAVEPRIRKLIELTPDADRANLLFGLGDALCSSAKGDAARLERGLACLREVQERWPTTDHGQRAAGRLFRYTKLAVGMPCPDFETVDADGNAFKLSDYKGKVTVVDFWGFW